METDHSTSCRPGKFGYVVLLVAVTIVLLTGAVYARRWHQEVSVACMVQPGLTEQEVRTVCRVFGCRLVAELDGERGFSEAPLSGYERPGPAGSGRALAYAVNGKILYVFVDRWRQVVKVFWARRKTSAREVGPQ